MSSLTCSFKCMLYMTAVSAVLEAMGSSTVQHNVLDPGNFTGASRCSPAPYDRCCVHTIQNGLLSDDHM